MKITIAVCKSVANEFNTLMALDPPIETGSKVKLPALKADIVEAAGELSPNDKLTNDTRKALTALGVTLPEPEKAPADSSSSKPSGAASGTTGKTPPKPRYSRITAAVEAVKSVGVGGDGLADEANSLYQANVENGKDNLSEANWAVNMVLKVMAAMKEHGVKA